jgi:uncharacterized membrane protein
MGAELPPSSDAERSPTIRNQTVPIRDDSRKQARDKGSPCPEGALRAAPEVSLHMKTVVGMFRNRDAADRCVDQLLSEGFNHNNVSIITQDKNGELRRHVPEDSGNKSGEAAAVGAGTGAVAGGIIGALSVLGAVLIPGIGVVAGPIAGAIGGALIGAAGGGIAGALIGLGIPDDDAQEYRERLEKGEYMVLVQANDDRADRAERIMNENDATDVDEFDKDDTRRENRDRDLDRGTTTGVGSSMSMAEDRDPDNYRGADRQMGGRGRVRTYESMTTFEPTHEYQNDWQQRYGSTGGSFDDYQPAYSFGHQRANDERFQNREWEDAEKDLQREWETERPGTWNNYRDAARSSWDRCRNRTRNNRARMM